MRSNIRQENERSLRHSKQALDDATERKKGNVVTRLARAFERLMLRFRGKREVPIGTRKSL